MFGKCKWILSLFAFLFSSCMAQVSKPSPARLGAVRGEDWHQERLVTIWILDPGTDQDNYLPPCWRGSLRIYPKSFNGWSWEGRLAVSTCFFQKKHGKKMHKDAPFRHRQAWQLTFGSAWWVRASGDLGGWRSCVGDLLQKWNPMKTKWKSTRDCEFAWQILILEAEVWSILCWC